ncbi:bacteriohemerythrin [Maridesulfovibrio salexigens]|uniref:Hemerythrin-like metal-binding protein n=1 Tax=Maridesulfovibrio salexigens (strain ATCC 14822 / DSM 2638 / NCIMB 8403 / VKM B-1763) TaxID=526222 RepID=C6BTR9_MARSD|nr:hemerythrin family protein [Maridesulfovibrio salexigens]ACS79849.1 hemerythrin-like metal-binding protein [Maridesulfovibrio salexigens DSM 2638]
MSSKTASGQPLHTGIGVIDSQHQTFFTILNKIRKKTLEGDSSDLSSFIEEIHLYTLYHFESEEIMMQKAGVPNLEEHKKIHQDFVEKVEELKLKCIVEDEDLVQDMTDTLESWFVNHILNIDKRDLEYVKNNS